MGPPYQEFEPEKVGKRGKSGGASILGGRNQLLVGGGAHMAVKGLTFTLSPNLQLRTDGDDYRCVIQLNTGWQCKVAMMMRRARRCCKSKSCRAGYLTISNDLHRALFGKSESVNGETIRPVRVLKYFIFAEMLLFLSNCQLHKQYNIPNIPLASRNKQKWGYSGGQEGEWSDLHQFLDERSTKARSERVCLCALSPVSNFIFIFAWLNFTPPTQLPMLAIGQPSPVSFFIFGSDRICIKLTGTGYPVIVQIQIPTGTGGLQAYIYICFRWKM